VISCPGFDALQHLQISLAADTGSTGTPSADGEAVLASDDRHPADLTAADPFLRLQRRLLLATLLLTLVVTAIAWPLFGARAARSLLLGGSCGLLYLRLLARSVARIGPESRSLGRFQIVVPASCSTSRPCCCRPSSPPEPPFTPWFPCPLPCRSPNWR
jgi:ATP synthase protein I